MVPCKPAGVVSLEEIMDIVRALQYYVASPHQSSIVICSKSGQSRCCLIGAALLCSYGLTVSHALSVIRELR